MTEFFGVNTFKCHVAKKLLMPPVVFQELGTSGRLVAFASSTSDNGKKNGNSILTYFQIFFLGGREEDLVFENQFLLFIHR